MDSIDTSHLSILLNKPLLTFHQDDVIGRPAYPYKWGYNPDWTFDPEHPAEYWSGPTSSGEVFVLMLNSEDGVKTRTALWGEVPELKSKNSKEEKKGKGFKVTDAWTGKDVGCVKDKYEVKLQAHDVAVLVVGEEC